MTTANPSLFETQRGIGETLRAHWRLFLFQGAIMIGLGVLAIAAPVWATLAVDVYVGWLFLISGVIGLVAMFSARNVPGFLWTFVTALLSVAVGALLLWRPIEGVLSLTIVLTAFFIVEGIFQAVAALIYRDGMPGSWGWLLVSGLADLALAAIIIMGWPGTAVWTLGLLVGVNLLTSGWAVVMVALGAREMEQSAPAAKR
jgi:uncharacterized membrane protein HdeD (DUF308 family)